MPSSVEKIRRNFTEILCEVYGPEACVECSLKGHCTLVDYADWFIFLHTRPAYLLLLYISMATIKIIGATVDTTECRARELAKLLVQYGVPFSYDSTPIKKENVLMTSLCISHKLQNRLELHYEDRHNDGKNPNWWIRKGEWEKATIEDFLAKFPSKSSLAKLRGIGKTSLQCLENALQQHGYELKEE